MNNATHVLVTMSGDWADEFDIFGMKVMSKSRWDAECFLMREYGDVYAEWFFGTNEVFEQTLSEFHRMYNAKQMEDSEVEFLVRTFPHIKTYHVGQFCCPSEIIHPLDIGVEATGRAKGRSMQDFLRDLSGLEFDDD